MLNIDSLQNGIVIDHIKACLLYTSKEKHAMRYTQYRGLAQVTNWVKLKFAAMNLKKLAIWLWREKLFPFISILLCTLYDRNPAYA